MKKVFLILVLFLSFSIKVNALDTSLKVYDFNQSINPRQENILREKAKKYIKKYNIDMVFITVKYHEAKTTEKYAKQFFEKNKFGVMSSKNAIIFVLDYKDDTNLEIFTNGSANEIFTKIEKDELIESINLDDDSYKIFNKLISATDKKMGDHDSVFKYIVFKKIYKKDYLVIFIISVILSSIIMGLLILKSKKYTNNVEEYKKVNFHITKSVDKFLGSRTEAYRHKNRKSK